MHALLAQLVEHLHGKEGVNGSSPLEGSAKAPHVGAFSFSRQGDLLFVERPVGMEPVGRKTRSSCCGEFVFVNQTAEQITAVHMESVSRRDRCGR